MLLKGFITLLTCYLSFTVSQDIDEIRTRIDQFVNDLLECYEIPGAIVSIVKGNEVISAKGYGVRNLDTREPVTDKDLFVIASVTKQFVAAVVGKVLQKHNYTYETPVREILGEWFYFKDPYRTSKVTVRDTLSHRTGLPRNDMMRVYNYTIRELYEKVRHLDTTAAIRSEYKYNNLMYGLAGYVASVLEGKSWEDLCREHVYGPLGMNYSTFVHQARDRWQEFVTQYRLSNGEPRAVSLEHPSTFYMTISSPGGISSNAIDMAKWLQLLLNQGQTPNGTQVFDAELIQSLYAISMPMTSTPMFLKPDDPVTFGSRENYGMGFTRGYYREYSLMEHSGSQAGYLSLLNLLRDLDMAVFSSVNIGTSNRFRAYVHLFIVDLLLGKEPFLNSTNACPDGEFGDLGIYEEEYDEEKFEFRSSPKSTNNFGTLFSDLVIGTYTNHAYGDLVVYRNSTDQEIYMSYGPVVTYFLVQTGVDLTYEGFGVEPFWSLRLGTVEFKDCEDQPCESVSVSFDRESPPEFFRNPAPEPPPTPPCPAS